MCAYDWKTVAVGYLGEYGALERAVATLPRQIARCRGTGPYEGDERLDAAVRRFQLERQLRQSRDALGRLKKALGALTPQEKLILGLLYITPEKGNVQRLCGILECEQATVYRRRDRALKKFTKAMFGS